MYQFRGKTVFTEEELNETGIAHTNGWVYGSLITNGGTPFIVGDIVDWGSDYIAHEWWVGVIPGSIGQCTNLVDKEGTIIYENDIFLHMCRTDEGYAPTYKYVVYYDEDKAGYAPFVGGGRCGHCGNYSDGLEYPLVGIVVGNTFEDKLKKKGD